MADDHFTAEVTLTATDFKAKCLSLLDQVQRGELTRVTVTKRGRPVATVTAPPKPEKPDIFGCLKDQTYIPEGLDLTEPVLDEPLDAELGIWDHRER